MENWNHSVRLLEINLFGRYGEDGQNGTQNQFF